MVLSSPEKTVAPEDMDYEQSAPKLTLLTSEEEIHTIEHKEQLDTLSKFQKDFGLAEGGKALEPMAEHNSKSENAASFVKATIANETYLSALDHIQNADKHSLKPADLVDLQLLRKGDPSALLEAEKPDAPKLKEDFGEVAKSGDELKKALNEGFADFYEQMTGIDLETVRKDYEELTHEVRNIKTVNSPQEKNIVERRAKLDYELRSIASVTLKSKYDGIVMPNPVGIVNKIAFDVSSGSALSASEFTAKFDSLKQNIRDLKSENDQIKPDSTNFLARPPRKQAKTSFIGDLMGLFKRKA